MGFYIDIDVLDSKDRKKIGHVQNEKGGLGRAIYMFQPKDFKFEKETRSFTCETTVGEAVKNLTAIINLINKETQVEERSYDKWSSLAIKAFLAALPSYKSYLSRFNDDDIVFADMSEGMLAYNDEQLNKFRPDIDYNSAMKFITNVIKGNYNGYFCDDEIRRVYTLVFDDISEQLLKHFPNIKKIQKDYNYYNLITMGDIKVLEMRAEIIFTKDVEDDREEWAYPEENYLLPVFAFLQKKCIHMNRTYDKVFSNMNADERGFSVVFHFNVSSFK